MIISHRHRFIFFHNPKTAGMSLRTILAPYHDDPSPLEGIFQRPPFDYLLDFAHLRLREISVLFPAVIEAARTYRSLVLVRDPYRRFVSAVDQHFKTFYPELPLPTMRPEQQALVVEMFVDKMLHLDAVLTDFRFVHFSPQVWFLQSGGLRLPGAIVPMDDRGKFIACGLESLGLPAQAVPHDNQSRLDLTHVLRRPKINAFVRDFYAEDFAFFAADPALAHLAGGRHDVEAAPDAPEFGSRPVRSAVAPAQATDTQRPTESDTLRALSAQIDRAAVDLAAGRVQEALDGIEIVLAENPDHPRGLGLFGQIAVFTDRPAIGLAALQRAVARDPSLEHRVWLAVCLAKLGCPEDAEQVIAAAIRTMPPTANAYFAVGMVLYEIGHYDDAARCYGDCIALDPRRADARHRHARALQAAGKIEAAIDAYREAIENCATDAACHTDLSAALSDLGRFEEAYAAGRIAVKLDPDNSVAHNNLGHALHNLNRGTEAVTAYEKAIGACDTYAKAQFGRALALLKCGDFERGWRQYEWRWQDTQTPRLDLGVPIWRGEDFDGRTILLHAEQGLGDTLQFIRFAPLVAARGGRVVLEVPAPLVRLMRGVEGVAEVIVQGDPIPPIDLHCPMASLPLAFDLRLDTIPAAPYLPTPPEGNAPRPSPRIRESDLVVGLVWAGDPRRSEPGLNRIDRRRSTTIEALAPLLDIDNVQFVSFQLGEARAQLSDSKWPIIDAMEGVADFADTAARLRGVDLLISVDTSMVHLAGGLGVPVWMLSRFDGCWRWLEQRDDTPWYPAMRIFRQPSPGDWSSVVADIGTALRKRLVGSNADVIRPWRQSQHITRAGAGMLAQRVGRGGVTE